MSGSLTTNFTNALLLAITDGVPPPFDLELGTKTLAAISAIAEEHPETPVAFIADAYDAFRHEHLSVTGETRCARTDEVHTQLAEDYPFAPRESPRLAGRRPHRAEVGHRLPRSSQESTEAS